MNEPMSNGLNQDGETWIAPAGAQPPYTIVSATMESTSSISSSTLSRTRCSQTETSMPI